MPGRLLLMPQSASREAGKTMGVHKLTFPGASQESALTSKASGFRSAFMGRRFHIVDDRNLAQPRSKTTSLEMEHFTAISEDDLHSESVCTASSTRTSNTISDDDSSLMEFASRTSTSVDGSAPARHSTACCSHLAFRRELRKRFPVDDDDALRRDSPSSFALGNSFRRELEQEDRVESLVLWEETDQKIQPASTRNVTVQNATPHSWHGGDTASGSTRNKGLDNILRKKKPSFLKGFFSGLSFLSSRKSRTSLG